jgi:hypothetical protein
MFLKSKARFFAYIFLVAGSLLSKAVIAAAPVITSTPVTTATANASYNYTITATDADNDQITFTAPTLPSWLQFNSQEFIERTGSDNPFNGLNVGQNAAPVFADIDNDGDPDIFIAAYGGAINYYHNQTIDGTPLNNPFIGVDVGLNSVLAFVDIDNDGDLDAFIGEQVGTINYYKNTGSNSNPIFSKQTGSDNPFDGVDVGLYSALAFADIDNDGDMDAFIGEQYGIINYYKNTGSNSAPTFSEQTGSDNPFDGVDVGSYSAPTFFDIDNDGDMDAFIGEQDGIINYYKNTGSNSAPTFSEQTGSDNPFDGVDVGEHSIPTFANMDMDGDMDLFIGASDGTVKYVENTSGISGTPSCSDVGNHNVEVAVSDGTESSTQNYTLTVNTDASCTPPAAPTDITLNSSNFNENSSAPTTIGTLNTTDVNTGDTFTYSLVSGDGDTDNTSFSISGDVLSAVVVADYETKSTYTIRVQTTDNTSRTFAKSLIIGVTDLNTLPTAPTLSNNSVDENMPIGTVIGILSSTDDGENNNTLTFSVNNSDFAISGNQLVTNKVFDKEVDDPFGLGLNVGISASDGSGSTGNNLFITLNDVNDAPTITSNPSLTATVNTGYSYTITATDDEDDPITFTAPTIPSFLTFSSGGAQVSTFAGSAVQGAADGTGTAAQFDYPYDIAIDSSGNLFVADRDNEKIRKITPAGEVTTFAGLGLAGSTDGTGTAARFNGPRGLAFDGSGNLFVADTNNHKIRKITPAGVVSTFAGSGSQGNTDGTGTAASFRFPRGIAIDSSDNLYVVDVGNHTVRKITPAGVVTTFAGSGSSGSTDGTGTAASFNAPNEITIDSSGNLFVADTNNNKIRKITPAGVVTTVAGSSAAGYTDATGTAARFYRPFGITIDSSGNLFVADYNNHKIRKITPAGVVTTVAGSSAGDTDATGTAARFDGPIGITIDSSGNLFVADASNHKIRKIDLAAELTGTPSCSDMGNHSVEVVASDGTDSSTQTYTLTVNNDGSCNSLPVFTSTPTLSVDQDAAYSYAPTATDSDGTIASWAAPTLPSWLSFTTATGAISGTPTNDNVGSNTVVITVTDDGGATATQSFTIVVNNINDAPIITSTPVLTVNVNNTYTYSISATDADNDAISWTTPTIPSWATLATPTGNVSTLIEGLPNYSNDFTFDDNGNLYVIIGAPTNKIIKFDKDYNQTDFMTGLPWGQNSIARDSSGNFFFADSQKIYKAPADGSSYVVFAGQSSSGYADGNGANAIFNSIQSMIIDKNDNLYVTERLGNKIRKITPSADVTTVAGASGSAGSSNGTTATATFNQPRGIAVTDDGIIYIGDTGNNLVRKIENGNVTTFAGDGSTDMYSPAGMSLDKQGNLYVAVMNDHDIRKFTPDGVQTIIAGTFSGFLDGPGNVAKFSSPMYVEVLDDGNLLVLDYANRKIRKIDLSYSITGTPSCNDMNDNSFEIVASDGNGGTDTQTFSITITDNAGICLPKPTTPTTFPVPNDPNPGDPAPLPADPANITIGAGSCGIDYANGTVSFTTNPAAQITPYPTTASLDASGNYSSVTLDASNATENFDVVMSCISGGGVAGPGADPVGLFAPTPGPDAPSTPTISVPSVPGTITATAPGTQTISVDAGSCGAEYADGTVEINSNPAGQINPNPTTANLDSSGDYPAFSIDASGAIVSFSLELTCKNKSGTSGPTTDPVGPFTPVPDDTPPTPTSSPASGTITGTISVASGVCGADYANGTVEFSSDPADKLIPSPTTRNLDASGNYTGFDIETATSGANFNLVMVCKNSEGTAGPEVNPAAGPFTPTLPPDTDAPTLSNLNLSVSTYTALTASLSWTEASDTRDPAASLTYSVYYSKGNNLDSMADIQANGTLATAVGSLNPDKAINSLKVKGLEEETTYYFNVIVKDSSNNKANYNSVSVTTNKFSAKDSDGDGIPDDVEEEDGTDGGSADSPRTGGSGDDDDDGLPNALEEWFAGYPYYIDPLDPDTDTDEDGVPDYIEFWKNTDPKDNKSPQDNGGVDTDGDGTVEEGGEDTDGDGISDAMEKILGTDKDTKGYYGETTPDTDGDGVPDSVEEYLASEPFNISPVNAKTDTDGDGLPDVLEVVKGYLPKHKNSPVKNTTDLDGDGILEGGGEDGDGTNKNGGNNDNDLVTDAVEWYLKQLTGTPTITMPVTAFNDSDGDCVPDALEITNGTNPQDKNSPVIGGDTDNGSGVPLGCEKVLNDLGVQPVTDITDSDFDLIPDAVEIMLGSNPLIGDDKDSDEDGLSDAAELYLSNKIHGIAVAISSFTFTTDTDGDGLFDYLEITSNGAEQYYNNVSLPIANGGDDENGITKAMNYWLVNHDIAYDETFTSGSGDIDSDGDGANDVVELQNGKNPFINSNVAPTYWIDFQQPRGNSVETIGKNDGTVWVIARQTSEQQARTSTYSWGTATSTIDYEDNTGSESNLLESSNGIASMTTNMNTKEISFDPSGMSVKDYLVSFEVSSGIYTYKYTAFTTIADNNSKDSDNDGIPDDKDVSSNEGLQSNEDNQASSFLITTNEPSFIVRAGSIARKTDKGSANVSDELGSGLNNDTGFNHNGETYDYEIVNIPAHIDSVQVIIPLQNAIGANASYRKLQNGSWVDFSGDADNFAQSAGSGNALGNCSGIVDADWSSAGVAREGDKCVRITLKDGGAWDSDGVVNGQIKDPFGVASSIAEGNNNGGGIASGGGGGCVLVIDNNAKFDPTLYLLLFISMLLLLKRYFKHILTTLGFITMLNANAAGNITFDEYYIAMGVGISHLEPINYNVSDKSDLTKNITIGASINKNIALELGYNNLGKAKLPSGESIDYKIKTLGVVYTFDVEKYNFNPFAEIGIRHASTNSGANIIDTTNNYIGVGISTTLDAEKNTDARFSYNDYAKDAQNLMIEIIKKW